MENPGRFITATPRQHKSFRDIATMIGPRSLLNSPERHPREGCASTPPGNRLTYRRCLDIDKWREKYHKLRRPSCVSVAVFRYRQEIKRLSEVRLL
jgi:hypothetical protein